MTGIEFQFCITNDIALKKEVRRITINYVTLFFVNFFFPFWQMYVCDAKFHCVRVTRIKIAVEVLSQFAALRQRVSTLPKEAAQRRFNLMLHSFCDDRCSGQTFDKRNPTGNQEINFDNLDMIDKSSHQGVSKEQCIE
uniref:Uncharacterized protein n=1 Tax=Romanomermis culicivorax TaxID=13658 RepID=A0A915J6B6_ROMCU